MIEDTSDRLRGGTLKMFMDPVFPDAANYKCHDNGEMERVGTMQYYTQEEADELVLSAHKLGDAGDHPLSRAVGNRAGTQIF